MIKEKVIRLSEAVYSSTSAAALTYVAALASSLLSLLRLLIIANGRSRR